MPRGDLPVNSYADLLAAWEQKTCVASGVELARIRHEDQSLVKQQRESRGGLLDWLLQYLGPVCETCEQSLYTHAQSYQDMLLWTLIGVSEDLGHQSHALFSVKLPAWCERKDYVACSKDLMTQTADGFKANVELFRRKATLVSLLNDQLDQLEHHRAKAYMTCRAVQAAKIDFDATDESRNFARAEDKRRAEQFFRIEASVGMD
ncbi:MAG: hypothetical protein IPN53_17540 [Comamonadaceae bacterium]|nr:hypothetical protein [Comamonadaceae bacterium]